MTLLSDRVVNAAMLVTCVVMTGAVLQRSLTWGVAGASAAAVPGMAKEGDRAPAIPGVDYADSVSTLVMYSRSTCQYCTASMPFYASLRSSLIQADVRLVAASSEAVDVTEQYLARHGVTADQSVVLNTAIPTPTLMLVDRSGTIRKIWVGQQDKDGEAAIVAAIHASS